MSHYLDMQCFFIEFLKAFCHPLQGHTGSQVAERRTQTVR